MKNILPPKQSREVVRMAETILDTFSHFGVDMKLVSAKEGLRSYHFELEMITPVRMKLIEGFLEDLKYALSTSKLTITAPIPDKKLIGVEVTKSERPEPVPLTDTLSHPEYTDSSPLTIPLGIDEYGLPTMIDLARTPHLLIGGTTGSGKSTLLHSFITGLIHKNSPETLRLILIDPKRVEFNLEYKGLPHLLTPVIMESKKALRALEWLNKEMERRYDILEAEKCQNIRIYHKQVYEPAKEAWQKAGGKTETRDTLPEALPYIVVCFDEFSDVITSYPREIESIVIRIAQMSRGVGIHLVIATSRPSSSVVSGALKANIPSRIAMSVASYVDSRTLLDQNGAEKLQGMGDMLYLGTEDFVLRRYQGYAIESKQIHQAVKTAIHRDTYTDRYDVDVSKDHNISFTGAFTDSDEDELYQDAKAAVIEAGKASTSYLQRKLRIGYSRAARLIDLLEEGGIIGPVDGIKSREVISN